MTRVCTLKNAREPVPGEVVEVYRNLNRRCWSVRAGGVVIAHADEVWLRDVEWVVHFAGRQRVLATGQKNVHAFGRGEFMPGPRGMLFERYRRRITYDPKRHTTFIDAETHEPVGRCYVARFHIDEGVSGWNADDA
jgi:hypothetical protein